MTGVKDAKRRMIVALFIIITTLMVTEIAFAAGGKEPDNYGVLSLITPLLAIVLSFVTKQVIVSLGAAVYVGAVILDGGNLVKGFLDSCSTYVVGTVTDDWDAKLLIFILCVGGMIAVMGRMGGLQAMALAMSKKTKTAKHTMIVTWILGIIIFFEDMANSLIVGPTMRPIADKQKISREKLSYIVDSTAGPVTDMAFVSSWIAYEVGMMAIAFESVGLEDANAYSVFIQTIPFRFYNILAIVMVGLIIFMQRDYGPMYKAEKRARLTGKLYRDGAHPMMSEELDAMNIKEGTPLRVSNAVVPIVVFVVVTLVAMYYTGGGFDMEFGFKAIQDSFGNSDSAASILYAVVFSSILCIVMAVAQKIMTLREAVDIWLGGCKELLLTVTILTLAWSAGGVMSDLGTGMFIAEIVGDSIPGVIIPVVLFLVSMVVAFSTGTSYGTTAIMIPIAFPMAWAAAGGEINSLTVLTIAAVTSGAIFGDHCSPISDTTIMSSMGTAADLLDHAKTQLPYAATVAGVAAVTGYIPAAMGLNPIISLVIGIAVLALIVRFVGKSTKLEDLEAEFGKADYSNADAAVE